MDKLNLAQLMWADGREDAFEFAYNITVANLDNPEVCLKYSGLFFGPLEQRRGFPFPDPLIVEEGVWVRLERDAGEPLSFVVADSTNLTLKHFAKEHPIAKGAFGKRTGESFEITNGPTRTIWRVRELKSKYLYLFHDIIDTFQDRFPGHSALYKLTIEGNDFTPIIDQAKAQADRASSLLEAYFAKRLPLGMAARVAGGRAIQFAMFVAQSGKRIVNATGIPNECQLEKRVGLQVDPAKGVVLDAYTAWFLAVANLISAAKSVFGRLLLPQTVIDEFDGMIEELSASDAPRLTMVWRDERVNVTEVGAEVLEREQIQLIDMRNRLLGACETVGVEVAESIDADMLKTLSLVGSALDAPLVAARENSGVLSADLHLRVWSTALFGVPAIGVKGFLEIAKDRGILSREQCGTAVLMMAQHRHSHLPISGATLYDVYNADQTRTLNEFAAVAKYIGAENAEPNSHLEVAGVFLRFAWLNRPHDLRLQRATSTLLRNVIRLKGVSTAQALRRLLHLVGEESGARRFVVDWIRGHFLISAFNENK